ncbi:MAG: FAD-binding oxidoreductase [Martelella sp.]|uniref:NAD(P)/FAD-dependent oxidoreductase n=1 Tax=Martelella sp. TaxID=1969699 RepID=UPI0032427D22
MPSADLAIIGGGIMGLWAAYHAEKAGIDTLLIDSGGPATSNGLLGALMAYMPDQWDEKKQFQFEALAALEGHIRALEAETGVSTGYRRAGRVMPLYAERQVETALSRAEAAAVNWRDGRRRFAWSVVDRPPLDGWPAADPVALAYVHENFAAHVFPRGVIAALRAFLENARHVRRLTATVTEIDAAANNLHLADGGRVGFGRVIVSAGVGAFPLLQPLFAPAGKPLGRPVKGQAALFAADCDPAWPIVFDDGLYVIAHEGGCVAVGSTTEDAFEDAATTDHRLDALIAAARRAVPLLRDAPVVERWAGLRPRGIHREPMIGAIDAAPRVIALGGGFKTSFGIAHWLADHALRLATGQLVAPLPDIYELSIYRRRAHGEKR